MTDTGSVSGGLVRRVGLFQATALNMSQMVGVGPFITIPLMVGAFGGPQAVVGFVAGALLALLDGLVWAELGAAMPGAGGTYVYVREAFQYRTGKLMPFLFVWTAILFIPLIMSTGVIGLVQYLGYLWPSMGQTAGDLVGVGVVALVMLLLWRRIESIAKLTTVMWGVMLLAVVLVLAAAYTNFDPSLAFDYPKGAFDVLDGGFWAGFAGGLAIGVYDYLGYNTAAYLGSEIKDPGRIMPRAIIYSVLGVLCIYLLLQIGSVGAIDWHRMTDPDSVASTSVASAVLESAWGRGVADVATVLILITAFASVFAGLLAGSRVPYDAARDGVFYRRYATLHPRHRFPVLGLITMGVITTAGFLIGRHTDLQTLIQLLTTVMVLVQTLSQIVALTVLRRRQPQLRRPYRMWLYPLPSILAFAGWTFMYGASDHNAPGRHPIEWSLAWLALGMLAFALWARKERTWPFGDKEIREQYLDAQRAGEEGEPEPGKVSS
ncbi:APC family permease [Streptomyces sp. HNM0575]|uniref:APC family permease n=1 Tax=Streptomyces sp. HNM0575 TaxID=2716338 RepID=UPI00145DDE8E|nr:APC family permease [Streptomyces sp. HNM0575]NLU71519.1 APC family permease [Streptomyces sp. HNM0575]